MGETDPLRELHEAYVWAVNAAVAEGRMDLVWRLADEFTDEAVELMTAMQAPGCGRSHCPICTLPSPAPRAPARRRWFWLRNRSAA